jgi:hypothetical protein
MVPKILTHYEPIPIKARGFDWSATFGSWERENPIGWGSTEAEAIADLQSQYGELEIEDRGNETVLPERAARNHT